MAGSVPVSYHPKPGKVAFSAPPSAEAPELVLEPGFNVVFAGNLGTAYAMAPAKREQMATRGRRYFEVHFEPQTLAKQLLAHLEGAVRGPGINSSRQAG